MTRAIQQSVTLNAAPRELFNAFLGSRNVGLFAMVTFSLSPVGSMQTWASVEHGYWYARSPEFLQTGAIEMFRWLRVIGDTICAAGAVALAIFVISLRTGGSTGRQAFHVGESASVRGQS